MLKYKIVQISVVGIVAFPYVTKYLYPPKTFEEGKIQGYEDAREELRTAAKSAVAKTFEYIKNDAKNPSSVTDTYLEDKIKIVILPRWELQLLGDKYIVRSPFRASWNNAWLMTESDSDEIDRQIEVMLRGTKFAMDLNKTGLMRREIINSTHRIIDEKKRQCLQSPISN